MIAFFEVLKSFNFLNQVRYVKHGYFNDLNIFDSLLSFWQNNLNNSVKISAL